MIEAQYSFLRIGSVPCLISCMRFLPTWMLIVTGTFLFSNLTWGVGFQLGETKEESKLDYEFTVKDHGTGRVTANLVISDSGRLKPLNSVNLAISSEDGTGYSDLSVALDVREADGKQYVRVHLLKKLAERAEIQLRTSHIDGKRELLTWYYHAIPIVKDLNIGVAKEPAPSKPFKQENAKPAASIKVTKQSDP